MKGAHASCRLTVSTSQTLIVLVCREPLCRLRRCPRHSIIALEPNHLDQVHRELLQPIARV
jgi:hypothetical protein